MGMSIKELQEWYASNKATLATTTLNSYIFRDPVKSPTRNVRTINREELINYLQNVSKQGIKLRKTAEYLYYRSNLMYRLVNWYSGMWDLRCRKVTPEYSLVKDMSGDKAKAKVRKAYEKSISLLDVMNLQGNMAEVLINVYLKDIYFGIKYMDNTGMFFFPLEPDECVINKKYSTGDFGYCMDMSKWDRADRQIVIEALGSPLKEMYDEYRRTRVQWVNMPDEYAACFKFRSDTWDISVPPLLPLFLQLAGHEDLIELQADADELDIYKLIYMPLKTQSGAKLPNDFTVNPELAKKYFDKLVADGVLPKKAAAAMVPVEELRTIDFKSNTASDINNVEKSTNQILQSSGGGAILNTEKLTTNAAFKAWLKEETNFAMSTLLPQINGFANRTLKEKLGKAACKVDHFKVSDYTKEDFAKTIFESCQYSFSNRIAYATLLGFSEKETLANIYLEESVLGLHELMKYPLVSSYTTANTAGAPTKDDGDLTPEGDRSRNA